MRQCGICKSSRVNMDVVHGLHLCFDCGAFETSTGWRRLSLEEIATLPTLPPPANRNITEEDAKNWWNAHTPRQRYSGMGCSGWDDDTILHGPFSVEWDALPKDVQASVHIGMKHGNYWKL
jgi:hypothetical protein